MIETVDPIQFHGGVSSGKTRPSRIVCVRQDGSEVELIAKVAGSCDEGVTNLARECIGACLAADLGLPVPRPYLVRLLPEWVESIPDPERRERAARGGGYAFGSLVVPSGFRLWTTADRLAGPMMATALGVLVFDGLMANPDRRDENPNCFVRGDDLRIFDHELAFTHRMVIGWRSPWVMGSLQALERNGFHIFRNGLRQQALDYEPVLAAWQGLSDHRLQEYRATLPGEWAAAANGVDAALSLIADARDHIDGCLEEVQRVLK